MKPTKIFFLTVAIGIMITMGCREDSMDDQYNDKNSEQVESESNDIAPPSEVPEEMFEEIENEDEPKEEN